MVLPCLIHVEGCFIGKNQQQQLSKSPYLWLSPNRAGIYIKLVQLNDVIKIKKLLCTQKRMTNPKYLRPSKKGMENMLRRREHRSKGILLP
jgi:hypothetical protein